MVGRGSRRAGAEVVEVSGDLTSTDTGSGITGSFVQLGQIEGNASLGVPDVRQLLRICLRRLLPHSPDDATDAVNLSPPARNLNAIGSGSQMGCKEGNDGSGKARETRPDS